MIVFKIYARLSSMSQLSKPIPTLLRHSRIAIFASYSAENMISREVIYYLQKLKEIVDGIVFIADNDLPTNELEKLSDFVIYADCQHHGQYDFGSYAKGFFWLKQTKIWGKFDELLICNDSVLGPYRPLSFFLESKQKAGNPPFFGCTINHLGWGKFFPHIQSYFFTIHKSVYNSDFFSDFIASIQQETDKTEIVKKYEMGLSELMQKHNIRYDAIYSKSGYCDPCREFIEHFNQMLFIKRNRFKKYHTFKLNNMLAEVGFPYMIINGRFAEKTIVNQIKSAFHVFLEPARILRQMNWYKRCKYNKKQAKINN